MATAMAIPNTKTEAVEMAARYKGRYTRAMAKAKVAGEQILQFGVAVGVAAGVGYWMGRDAKKGVDPQWAGLDKEVWIGGGLAVLGLTKLGGESMSGFARAAGTGVLSAWGYNAARTRAIEAA